MDIYIKESLNLCANLSVEEAAPHCAKLLDWLINCRAELKAKNVKLTYTDIECMFKATLYIHECHNRFGDLLMETLLLQRIDAADAVQEFYSKCTSDCAQCIRDLCHSIVGTKQGTALVPLLHHLHKPLADVQPAWSAIKDMDWSAPQNEAISIANIEFNTQAEHMRRLVSRIFRLPTLTQIETALQRALSSIGFELWLQLFREPKQSIWHSRCFIVRQMICDMLNEGTSDVCVSFVQNIYFFVSSGSSILVHRFWRCLSHVRFALSLMHYLYSYWQCRLPHIDLDDLQMHANAPDSHLPLDAAAYLTHLILHPKSTCRSEFYAKLCTLKLVQELLELLNKVAYVYS